MTAFGDMPFGMNQIKVECVVGSDTIVRTLPAAISLKFKERTVAARGRGGDQLVALASAPNGVEWEMQSLGVALEVYALMTGKAAVPVGESVPGAADATNTLTSSNTRNPYFNIYGKALGVGADDIHYKIIDAKLTEGMDAPLEDGKFTQSAFKGLALDWEIKQEETATNLPEDAEAGS